MAELLGENPDEWIALALGVFRRPPKIIQRRPTEIPELLRETRGLTTEQLREVTERIRKLKERGGTLKARRIMNESKIQLTERLRAEGRWSEASNLRETARADFRAKGMGRQEAVDAAWEAMAEAYPPLPVAEATTARVSNDGGRVRGLGDIPANWPTLPDNAPLPAELGWVQAQRLRVVEERPSGATVVHLKRAGSPPPSWAALGWLETSIRSYAKFVDICAKGLAQHELESDMVRREKRSIEDVRRLLAEMVEDQHK